LCHWSYWTPHHHQSINNHYPYKPHSRMTNIVIKQNTNIPVKTKQEAFKINGTFTEFLYQQFANVTVVHISQLNKPGTIIRAVRDAYSETDAANSLINMEEDDDLNSNTFTIQILSGKRREQDSLVHVEYLIARQLIEKIVRMNTPLANLPLLLCISLDKKFESEIQQTENRKLARELLNSVIQLALDIICL
jgi:hypothetical protein